VALSPLHLLVLLSLALGALLWGVTLILGGQGVQLQRYLALLGFYGVCSAVFVVSRIRRGNLQLFEIPVFMTILYFVQFGLVPLRNFIDPTQLDVILSANGEELVQALSYIILGMMAFWAGCELVRRKEVDRISARPATQSVVPKSNQAGVLFAFGALYAVGFITKVYLLKNHLYEYVGSTDKYFENLASMQVLNYVQQFGTLALIVATIERYRNRPDPLWRFLFVAALASEIFWGLISGMKTVLLQNFVVVALVSSFVMKRLNLRWLVGLFFALVLVYPLSNAYRSLVREEGVEVTSLEEAVSAAQMAYSRVQAGGSTTEDVWRQGLASTLQRVDLLTCVAQVLALGDRASIARGHVPWWMLPFYPFIPRFLWPSKPILQQGGLFTAALAGHGDSYSAGSSTAMTYPGDLYLQFGLLGVPIGMFVLGAFLQWVTNRVSPSVEPRDLFVYADVFLFVTWIECDAFFVWASLIKMLVILYALRLLIYGRSKGISLVRRSARRG
jgi:hypothetical protein